MPIGTGLTIGDNANSNRDLSMLSEISTPGNDFLLGSGPVKHFIARRLMP